MKIRYLKEPSLQEDYVDVHYRKENDAVEVIRNFFLSFQSIIGKKDGCVQKLLPGSIYYLVLVGTVLGVVWAASLFEPIHENGYRDMFISFSIPYGIAAAVYYISFFHEVRRVNRALEKIRRNQNAKSE